MKKLDKNSLDLVRENIEKLKEIFPDIFTEDKIDFEKLRENLGEFVEESDEKYQFTWFGKKKANQLALTPTKATLRPAKNESKNWETTKNIYIEGDNLEVLKVLQKAYYKKIKMIYIDPPYNTGKDFIYKDSYQDNLKNYLAMTGQIDEEGNPLTTNTEKSGRKHSNWLNMMYPRLKLARNLLRDDGVIFISIDDNEVANLRKIMDEIFGEENIVGFISVVNNLKGRSDDAFFATANEFLLVYAKNKNILKINGFEIDEEEIDSEYDRKDEIGYYKLIGFRKTGKGWERHHRPYMYYPILEKNGKFYSIEYEEFNKIYDSKNKIFNDDFVKELIDKYKKKGFNVFLPLDSKNNKGRWRWGFDKYRQNLQELELNDNNTVCTKMRATFEDGSIRLKKAKTIWYKPEYDTGSAGKLLKKLFNSNVDIFENPKSVIYLKDIFKLINDKNSIILDFFSGSATTAHAVMELNAEDGGNRQFILVQLPESTDEKSEAYKAGYKNICEIGKERIRRAGEKIKEDYKDKEWIKTIDIGFKVFKLDSTNIKEWDSNPDNLEQSLLDYGEFIKEGRSEEDLLYEVLLKYGIDLTTPIEEKTINGKKVYIVGFGSLIIYFDEIDIEIAKEIVNLVKNYESDFSVLVLKDDSFATSRDKVNIVEFFKQMNLFEKMITL